MSAALGAFALEIAARELVPLLLAEVSARALQHAVRRAAAPAGASPAAPRGPSRPERLYVPFVVSQLPGRLRLAMAGLRGSPSRALELEARLRARSGVRRADASALTGTVLVEFDPAVLTAEAILAAAWAIGWQPRRTRSPARPASLPAPFSEMGRGARLAAC